MFSGAIGSRDSESVAEAAGAWLGGGATEGTVAPASRWRAGWRWVWPLVLRCESVAVNRGLTALYTRVLRRACEHLAGSDVVCRALQAGDRSFLAHVTLRVLSTEMQQGAYLSWGQVTLVYWLVGFGLVFWFFFCE